MFSGNDPKRHFFLSYINSAYLVIYTAYYVHCPSIKLKPHQKSHFDSLRTARRDIYLNVCLSNDNFEVLQVSHSNYMCALYICTYIATYIPEIAFRF